MSHGRYTYDPYRGQETGLGRPSHVQAYYEGLARYLAEQRAAYPVHAPLYHRPAPHVMQPSYYPQVHRAPMHDYRIPPAYYPHARMPHEPDMRPAPHMHHPHAHYRVPHTYYPPYPHQSYPPREPGRYPQRQPEQYPQSRPDPAPQSRAQTTLNISPREFDALTRIAWYEGLRGYHGRHGLQPGINVAISILNKRVAGMHPSLSAANPDYANKDIVGLINQPRRYEPVWRYGSGNVFNLQLSAADRRIAEAAVREAIVNLSQHYHPGTLFQQTSVTNARGTSFIRSGEQVLRDGVGHEYSRSYRGGARTVTPPFRIGEQTLAMLGSPGSQYAVVPDRPVYRTRHIAYSPSLGQPHRMASAAPDARYPAPSPYRT